MSDGFTACYQEIFDNGKLVKVIVWFEDSRGYQYDICEFSNVQEAQIFLNWNVDGV